MSDGGRWDLEVDNSAASPRLHHNFLSQCIHCSSRRRNVKDLQTTVDPIRTEGDFGKKINYVQNIKSWKLGAIKTRQKFISKRNIELT